MLYQHLRQSRKKRRKRVHGRTRRGILADRVPIEERPPAIAAQERIGDGEGDTLAGRGRTRPSATFVERKTLFLVAARLPDYRAASLHEAAVRAFRDIPQAFLQTSTVDNGKAFAAFKELQTRLHTHVYLARPDCATDRAINENLNGLLRPYLPKGTDFAELTDDQLHAILQRINNGPRKKRGYRMPAEMLFRQRQPVALAG